MGSGLARTGFRIGTFMSVSAGALLLVLERGTAEFVLMQFTLILGVVFIGVIALLARLDMRR